MRLTLPTGTRYLRPYLLGRSMEVGAGIGKKISFEWCRRWATVQYEIFVNVNFCCYIFYIYRFRPLLFQHSGAYRKYKFCRAFRKLYSSIIPGMPCQNDFSVANVRIHPTWIFLIIYGSNKPITLCIFQKSLKYS